MCVTGGDAALLVDVDLGGPDGPVHGLVTDPDFDAKGSERVVDALDHDDLGNSLERMES